MENTGLQVLEQQIAEIETAIAKNKIDIGDLFLKIHSYKITDFDPDKLMDSFKDMEKMPPLISKHESYLTQLGTLQKTKAEIERVETGLLVK